MLVLRDNMFETTFCFTFPFKRSFVHSQSFQLPEQVPTTFGGRQYRDTVQSQTRIWLTINEPINQSVLVQGFANRHCGQFHQEEMSTARRYTREFQRSRWLSAR